MLSKSIYKRFLGLLFFSVGLEVTLHNNGLFFYMLLGFIFLALGFYNLFFNSYSEIKNLRPSLNLLKGKLGFSNKGMDRDGSISNVLKWLDSDKYKYFHHFFLEHHDEPFGIDTVIISRNRIFNVVTTTYTGNIVVDSEGNWIEKNGGNAFGVESPIYEVKKQRIVLDKLLGKTVPIVDLIVLTDGKCIIEGKNNSPITIIRLDSLLYFVENSILEDCTSFNEDIMVSKLEAHISTRNALDNNTIISKIKYLLKYKKMIISTLLVITVAISVFILYPFITNNFRYSQGTVNSTANNPVKQVQSTPTLIFLNDSITTALNNTVKITAKSIEKSLDYTVLNISIENSYGKDIQLFGSDNISLVDDKGNKYILKPMKSTNLFDSIPSGSIGDIKMVFEPIKSSYKTLNLKGEFWTIDLGAADTTFSIPISY